MNLNEQVQDPEESMRLLDERDESMMPHQNLKEQPQNLKLNLKLNLQQQLQNLKQKQLQSLEESQEESLGKH